MCRRYRIAETRTSDEGWVMKAGRCSGKTFIGLPAARGPASALFEGLVHEHHGDVADDRVDAMALHALESLFDDRLLAAELVAELLQHGGAARVREGHEL